jgi:Tfp pilus assembly protein PilO
MQTRMIAGVMLGVVAMAGFWFGVIAPKRDASAALEGQITAAQTRLQVATSTAATADQARLTYRTDYATLAKLGKAVPGDDDIASLVYQLESVARANKIDFRAVKLTGAVGGGPPPAAPADANSTGGDDKSSPTAAAPAPATVVSQAPPGTVVGTAGLMTVPFTITFDGGYMAMQRFLKAIDRLAVTRKKQIRVNGRLLTVDGFSLTPGRDGLPKLKAVVSATAYLVPPTDNAAASATPSSPGGAATPAPTTTALKTATE